MPEPALIDLSQDVRTGMPVFPGDPAVTLRPAGALAPWRVSELTLGTHSGTHIDAAVHYVPCGSTIDAYPLERFILPAYVAPVAVGQGTAIDWPTLSCLLPADLSGCAVLLATGWDRYWGDETAVRHPFLSEAGAEGLIERGVGLVGTDALNVDATQPATTHAHAALLGADILIVENLTNLGALSPGRPHTCAFVPLKLAGADGSPIRAYAFAGDV